MMFGKSFARKNCCHFFLLKNQISNARRWQRTLTSTALWCALQEIIQRGRPPKPPPHHWRVGNFWSGRMSCAMAIWMCEKVTSCEVNYSGSYCESSVLKHGVWCLMFVKFNLLKRSSQKHHIIIAFLSHLFQFPDMFSCQKKAKRVCFEKTSHFDTWYPFTHHANKNHQKPRYTPTKDVTRFLRVPGTDRTLTRGQLEIAAAEYTGGKACSFWSQAPQHHCTISAVQMVLFREEIKILPWDFDKISKYDFLAESSIVFFFPGNLVF